MGFFFKKKKNAVSKTVETREEKLDKNEGVPFTTQILDNVNDAHLAYHYEKVKCSITGNSSGLKEGAILYIRKNGVLANVAKEEIAQIENKKLRNMVNDFFDKDRFCTVRAKFVAIEDNSLFCNLGFYIDDDPDDTEEDDEEDEEE